jgi:hypothetical protein
VKRLEGIHLSDVNAVYSGAEGDLWELIMGQQIHWGLESSLDLADRAGIGAGQRGVDLCLTARHLLVLPRRRFDDRRRCDIGGGRARPPPLRGGGLADHIR